MISPATGLYLIGFVIVIATIFWLVLKIDRRAQ